MTIIQCVNNLDLGGLERVVLILGRQLRARSIGCEIVCIEDRGTLADEAERNGLPVIALHAEKAGKRSALRSMISHLKQVDAPVVLHSHNFKPFWYAARARFYGVAIGHVHTRHGAFLRRHRFLWRYRLMRRWTDAIATVSADGRDQLARWSGLRPQDIHVVPNGVDTDTYRPADSKMAVRQRLGWTQPGAVIITVARLAPEKDLATLLRAVALMPQVAW
ncbi:MAG: glycosyltransferase, partial [Verrucomicrobiae bacterium]|nr:glycosyltransferase [Verrucomicrobiae bacterium]